MTLRTKTLTAVAALLIGSAGLALAQDSATPAPAPQPDATAQTAPDAAATEAPAAEAPAADADTATETAPAEEPAATAETPATEAPAAESPAAEAPDADAAPTEEPAAEAAEAATDEAGDAAPAGTVAGQETSEELPADASADQSEAEETAQDAAPEAADDTAVEVTPAEEAAPAGDAAETAVEAESAEAPTVVEGETAHQEEEAIAEEDHGDEAAAASHGGGHIEDIAFSFEGPFGKYDQFQLQRGLQVYTEVCSACHGMKFVPIRTLADEGGPALPEDQVRAYAANMTIIDEETGEERPRLPTDHFPTVTGDGMGPDLSLMAKARAGFHGPYGTGISQLVNGIGGPEYIHAILTSYTGEESEQAGSVFYGNTAFSTGNIAMPAPLSDDLVTYEDGTPATVDQMARDVSAFLMWTAEPKMMDRKMVGLVSVLFLIVLTALLYLTNKRLWAPHKGKHLDH